MTPGVGQLYDIVCMCIHGTVGGLAQRAVEEATKYAMEITEQEVLSYGAG